MRGFWQRRRRAHNAAQAAKGALPAQRDSVATVQARLELLGLQPKTYLATVGHSEGTSLRPMHRHVKRTVRTVRYR
jgi:hypothetical protein